MCGGRCSIYRALRALSAAVTASGLASSSSFITSNGEPFSAASWRAIFPSCTLTRAGSEGSIYGRAKTLPYIH